ncbi:MAG: polysaccharide pyruvyl transferase family protein [Candidatus Colwellbacteria bacterium]
MKLIRVIRDNLNRLMIVERLRRAQYFFREALVFDSSQDVINAYWWEKENLKNFGDMLTPYLIEKLSGKKARLVNRYCIKPYYIVVGSVIRKANKHAIIWGAGIQSRGENIKKPNKILAVRGPHTRDRLLELGYDCEEIYGDPAVLLPDIYQPKSEKGCRLGIIPHYVDYQTLVDNIDDKSIKIIDVLQPVEDVIEQIVKCERTISSSLHGLIVSHAYKIPSIWVEFSDGVTGGGTKFADYLMSVRLPAYSPIDLRRKAQSGELSGESILDLFDKMPNSIMPEEGRIKELAAGLMSKCPFK